MSAQSATKSSSKSSAPKEIISGETFNSDKDIKYSKPKVNASGGKSVGILNSTTNGATYVSTPLMMTWGVSAFEDKKTGDKSYSMSLQFPGEEYNTPAITKFRTNIVKFEEKIKADALANQKEWFGKSTMTKDHIDMFWTPILKFAKGENGEPDHNKNPTLNVKMPIWEGVWNVELFDPQSRKIFPDVLMLLSFSNAVVSGSPVVNSELPGSCFKRSSSPRLLFAASVTFSFHAMTRRL